MVEEIELITLLGGIVVLFFLIWNRPLISRLPRPYVLASAYACFLLSWFMSVLESFALAGPANLAEHALNAVGSLLLCAWIMFAVRERRGHGR